MKYNMVDLDDITSICEVVDYKNQAKEIDDIIDILDTTVTGSLRKISEHKVRVIANVKTILILACARSLKEVTYPLDFNLDIVLSNDEESDYPLLNPIDLTDIIFGNIVAEKPYTVFHDSTSEEDFKEEKAKNSAFSDLDKLFTK
ncbi:hypothetical protein LJC17_01310 [Acholeplasma sp. OttesenSCG-928-E16]|nr:hypothetical protein [Acholeplasma sp. OttesenSCG-928-E16]